jgi:hypothetical protein
MMSSWLGSSFSASAAEVPGPERPAPAAPSNPLSPERTRADFLLAEQKIFLLIQMLKLTLCSFKANQL